MPGPSPVAAHAVAGRCWQATRTSVLQYRRCGTRPNCRHPLQPVGYFQALNPFALLGHNRDFGWSLTMFQNDDVDLIAERTNPADSNQVMVDGRWHTGNHPAADCGKVKRQSPSTCVARPMAPSSTMYWAISPAPRQ